MQKQILYISEAFSMQPKHIYVGEYWNMSDTKVAEIKEKLITINGDPFEVYEGYDIKGNSLFRYRKETVNVGYFA